jgi:hypothetical protein
MWLFVGKGLYEPLQMGQTTGAFDAYTELPGPTKPQSEPSTSTADDGECIVYIY